MVILLWCKNLPCFSFVFDKQDTQQEHVALFVGADKKCTSAGDHGYICKNVYKLYALNVILPGFFLLFCYFCLRTSTVQPLVLIDEAVLPDMCLSIVLAISLILCAVDKP